MSFCGCFDIVDILRNMDNDYDTTQYVKENFEVSEKFKNFKDLYPTTTCCLSLDEPIHQEIFKLAEDVIEFGIETKNDKILEIMDTYIFYEFYAKINLEYMMKSKYIKYCTNTYKYILYKHPEYKNS